jgi:two-component system phosphate regulon response regulator PhoB
MSADKTTILIVEDEPAIVELLTFTLRAAGWHVVVAVDAAGAWDALQRELPALVLLDWMLPDQNGLQLLGRIRAERRLQNLPVIMLTAKSMEEDKVAGLDKGADDYVTKPFSPRELTSRIKALLRRKSPEHAQEAVRIGALTLDPINLAVTLHGERLGMGQTEFRLLKFLMTHPERAFSRNQLLDRVWGDHVAIEERTVDVHVLRLRKALKEAESLIKTVRSVGYMLSAQ